MSEPKGYKGKLADFKPDSRNLNKHTQRGRGMVEASQRQRGFGRPGFAAKDGTMLGGNLSIMEVAADIELGDGDVFVVETDGDIPVVHLRRDLAAGTPEAVLLAAEDNQSALISIEFDPERFAEEIAQGVDFSGIFTADEQKGLLAELGTGGPQETGDPPIDKAAELQAEYGTALGQIWALGEHRLACGDCTDRAVVEAVMGGERADLFLTDPPYGVSYADKNAFLNTLAKGNAVQKRIENDHQSMDDMKTLWYQAAKNALDFSQDTAAYYWFACQGGDQMMMMMIGEAGWKVRHELIWAKNNHVLGRSDYQYKHEPILYGWKREGTHKFYGGFQTSVLEFARPQASDLHPTTKPVELISYLVANSTQIDDMVLDPFLGSGTTLIAAHQLNRRCRGIELDPGYCAVTINRWETLTGDKAELL